MFPGQICHPGPRLLRGELPWFEDGNAAPPRPGQQMAITGYDQARSRGPRGGQKHLVSRIGADGLGQRRRINEGRVGGHQRQKGREAGAEIRMPAGQFPPDAEIFVQDRR